MKNKKKLIILRDPVLVDSNDCDIQSSDMDEDMIKISECDNDTIIIHDGPKLSGPYDNKN